MRGVFFYDTMHGCSYVYRGMCSYHARYFYNAIMHTKCKGITMIRTYARHACSGFAAVYVYTIEAATPVVNVYIRVVRATRSRSRQCTLREKYDVRRA